MSNNKATKILDTIDTHTYLGIGTTRIKALLIGSDFQTIASWSYEWENQLENGIWTYSLHEIWRDLRESYREPAMRAKYGIVLKKVGVIGFSTMMHGYMAIDASNNLLVPFRTWRNVSQKKQQKTIDKTFKSSFPKIIISFGRVLYLIFVNNN